MLVVPPQHEFFKGDLLVLRIHGREVIWLNRAARVGCKDVCF